MRNLQSFCKYNISWNFRSLDLTLLPRLNFILS